MTSNGREHLENGSAHSEKAEDGTEARFTESAEGTTIDSGTAEWAFDAQHGGRLESWRWRILPPSEALHPSTRHNPPRPFQLVDSKYGALVDHFLPLGTTYDEFAENKHREFGDFVDPPYSSEVADLGGEVRINMVRDGVIRAGKREAEVRLMKSAGARSGSSDLSVLYRVINSSLRPIQILFGVEYNLYAPGLAEDPSVAGDGAYLIDGEYPDDSSLGSVGRSVGATSLALANVRGEMALQLGWDRECDLWRMPLHDDGATVGVHAVRVVAVWRLSIAPNDNWALGLWLAPG
jgi:Domain of unknown function (DUF1926)